MSAPHRIEGNRVYCHGCDHEWDRAQGGLQCPACESEFVEIIDSRSPPNSPPPVPPHPSSTQSPPLPPHPLLGSSPPSPQSSNILHNHNPWAPDPEEDDITTFEFNTGGSRGTFSFSTRTYTIGGGSSSTIRTSRDIATDDIHRNFETMLGNIMGFHPRRQGNVTGGVFFPANQNERGFGEAPGQTPNFLSMLLQGGVQQRNTNQSTGLFDLLGPFLNPGNARQGDMVFSQEAFDRVMTQLMEQNTSNAPGPASDAAIAGLERKPVDASMMGSDGKAECSICMDNLEIGDEVTVLPCKHWFHGDCIISWLREHDTCPHCRQSITNSGAANRPSSSTRRRSSRQFSSTTSSVNPARNNDERTSAPPESSSGVREARERYYAAQHFPESSSDTPPRERRSSERSQPSNDSGGGGGVAGWIRNRLPFSGQQ